MVWTKFLSRDASFDWLSKSLLFPEVAWWQHQGHNNMMISASNGRCRCLLMQSPVLHILFSRSSSAVWRCSDPLKVWLTCTGAICRASSREGWSLLLPINRGQQLLTGKKWGPPGESHWSELRALYYANDRSRGFGSARGQFWPIAIDRPTRPYNIASSNVQHVI
jgi:hypothetical protein